MLFIPFVFSSYSVQGVCYAIMVHVCSANSYYAVLYFILSLKTFIKQFNNLPMWKLHMLYTCKILQEKLIQSFIIAYLITNFYFWKIIRIIALLCVVYKYRTSTEQDV